MQWRRQLWVHNTHTHTRIHKNIPIDQQTLKGQKHYENKIERNTHTHTQMAPALQRFPRWLYNKTKQKEFFFKNKNIKRNAERNGMNIENTFGRNKSVSNWTNEMNEWEAERKREGERKKRSVNERVTGMNGGKLLAWKRNRTFYVEWWNWWMKMLVIENGKSEMEPKLANNLLK